MGCEVYANGRTIACKVADGKTIAAMPDVCLSPPSPPAGPIPLPYPNTAMASDTTNGSKTVLIGRQETALKNKSYFKQSNGDEAATKSFGMGVVTHQIQGKVAFLNWSMDVKFEGENIPRHLDLTGHNEASDPPNCPPWPYTDQMAIPLDHPCVDDMKKEHEACKDHKPNNPDGPDACESAGLMGARSEAGRGHDMQATMPSGVAKNRQAVLAMSDRAEAEACLRARRCMLQPYSEKKSGCCPAQTPHHLIEASALFHGSENRGPKNIADPVDAFSPLADLKRGTPGYRADDAPCVCAEGCTNTVGTHGFMHTHQSTLNAAAPVEELEYFIGGKVVKKSVKALSYEQAKKNANIALNKTFPLSGCKEACINSQLDQYHNKCGVNDKTKIGAVECGSTKPANVEFAEQNSLQRAMNESPYYNQGAETPFGPPSTDFGGMTFPSWIR